MAIGKSACLAILLAAAPYAHAQSFGEGQRTAKDVAPALKTYETADELAALLEARCKKGKKTPRQACALTVSIPEDAREGTWTIYFRPIFWNDGNQYCAIYGSSPALVTPAELWQGITLPNKIHTDERDSYLALGILGWEENNTACRPRGPCLSPELFKQDRKKMDTIIANIIWGPSRCKKPK